MQSGLFAERTSEMISCLHGVLQGVSVSASVLTIMALSVERFLAIRHPVTLRRVLTAGRLRSVIVVIWMTSVGVMLPLTVVRSVDHYPLLGVGQMISVCHEHWPRTVSTTHLYRTTV